MGIYSFPFLPLPVTRSAFGCPIAQGFLLVKRSTLVCHSQHASDISGTVPELRLYHL